MSRPKLATILRTVRHLRARQVFAQVRHLVSHQRGPAAWSGAAPELSTNQSAVAFPGAPAHARLLCDAGGERATGVELVGRRVDWDDTIDWDEAGVSPLWAYHLHQCDYLRASALAPALRGAVMLDWVLRHPAGVGWDPHPTSLRILTWGRLLLTEGAVALDEADEARVRRSLGQQALTLSRSLETRLQANHLLSNLIGVVFAGMLLEGAAADRWLALSDSLRGQLAEQIPEDGLHYERSPMYHSLLLEHVLDLVNLARSVPGRAPKPLVADLEACASRMLGALRVVTHPDGEIALFADSVLGIAHPPASLAAYAASLGVTSAVAPSGDAVLRDAGFLRLEAGAYCLIASVGGPSPSYMPGHSHCDALSFELSVAGRRVVTDTGVAEYVPGARRDRARATASHSTLQLSGAEQAELWSAFRIGGRPRVAIERVEPGSAEATCEGFATRGTVHQRRFQVDAEGVVLRDALSGPERGVRLPLPLAPGLEPLLSSDGDGASARIDLGAQGVLRIALPASLQWRVDRAPYFPEFSREVERACLVGEGELRAGEALQFALDQELAR